MRPGSCEAKKKVTTGNSIGFKVQIYFYKTQFLTVFKSSTIHKIFSITREYYALFNKFNIYLDNLD